MSPAEGLLSVWRRSISLTSCGKATWRSAKATIVCGTHAGEVIFLEPRGIEFGAPILTVLRFIGRPGETGIRYITRCAWCGAEFEPAPQIISAIESYAGNSSARSLGGGGSPCRDLSDAAFADPRLLSTRPHCAQVLEFNPFFADMR